MKISDISVVVFSRNNETTVGRCLESVRDFGAIIVVDSFSTDKTTSITRQYPVALYQRPDISALEYRRWVCSRVTTQWVLFINADEVMTPELLRGIGPVADPLRGGYGFRVSYRYLGRELKRGACPRRTGPRLVARADAESETPAGFLDGAIVRHGFADIHGQFETINRATSADASRCSRLTRWMSVPFMLVMPPAVFVYKYVLRFGMGDGARGFLYCLMSAYEVFIRYAKIRERGFGKSGSVNCNMAEAN